MSNFNFEEWKTMQEFPFTYWTSKIIGLFKGLSLLLFCVFFCLYLCDKIDWSLWIVTLPLWYYIPVIIITILLDYMVHLYKVYKRRKK